MKRLTWIIAMAVVGMSAFHTHAQETVRERIQRQQPATSTSSPLVSSSLRAEQLGRYSSFDPDNAKWLRVVYRYLDLSDYRNAPLYYPVQPEPGRTNFFTSIFRLLSEGKIDAYEYVDGNEVFADNYKIDFREFLDRFGIYYEVQDSRIVVNDADIPSGEVTGYYVKEAYFFDFRNLEFWHPNTRRLPYPGAPKRLRNLTGALSAVLDSLLRNPALCFANADYDLKPQQCDQQHGGRLLSHAPLQRRNLQNSEFTRQNSRRNCAFSRSIES